MKTIELTEDQRKAIALSWIEEQQEEYDGYKIILSTLFSGSLYGLWSWLEALQYAVTLCTKNFSVKMQFIKENLK